MRIYLSVGIKPHEDTASLETFVALMGTPLKLSDAGPESRRWLSIKVDIAEDKLHQIAALVDWL